LRYIIIDKNQGVFLGTHLDTSEDPDGVVYVLWSKDNFFSCSKAYSFDNVTDARLFADTTLRRWPMTSVAKIDTNEKYVDVIDLLKAGFGPYTHDMINCIPMANESIH